MRLPRTLVGVTLLWMTTSMPLIADDQEATVREQVQQERTQSLDRLSRLRDRIDKIQLQLEHLDIEKVVNQRLQLGTKPSSADELRELSTSEFPSELEFAPRSVELQFSKNEQSDFSGATVDISDLTSRAFALKRRFFEARATLRNKQRNFPNPMISEEQLQLAKNNFELATEEIDNFEFQVGTAIRARLQLLKNQSQERALIEQQVADVQTLYGVGRATAAAVAASKRELLQNQRQGFSVQDSIEQLEALVGIVHERAEKSASTEPPAERSLTPPQSDSGS